MWKATKILLCHLLLPFALSSSTPFQHTATLSDAILKLLAGEKKVTISGSDAAILACATYYLRNGMDLTSGTTVSSWKERVNPVCERIRKDSIVVSDRGNFLEILFSIVEFVQKNLGSVVGLEKQASRIISALFASAAIRDTIGYDFLYTRVSREGFDGSLLLEHSTGALHGRVKFGLLAKRIHKPDLFAFIEPTYPSFPAAVTAATFLLSGISAEKADMPRVPTMEKVADSLYICKLDENWKILFLDKLRTKSVPRKFNAVSYLNTKIVKSFDTPAAHIWYPEIVSSQAFEEINQKVSMDLIFSSDTAHATQAIAEMLKNNANTNYEELNGHFIRVASMLKSRGGIQADSQRFLESLHAFVSSKISDVEMKLSSTPSFIQRSVLRVSNYSEKRSHRLVAELLTLFYSSNAAEFTAIGIDVGLGLRLKGDSKTPLPLASAFANAIIEDEAGNSATRVIMEFIEALSKRPTLLKETLKRHHNKFSLNYDGKSSPWIESGAITLLVIATMLEILNLAPEESAATKALNKFFKAIPDRPNILGNWNKIFISPPLLKRLYSPSQELHDFPVIKAYNISDHIKHVVKSILGNRFPVLASWVAIFLVRLLPDHGEKYLSNLRTAIMVAAAYSLTRSLRDSSQYPTTKWQDTLKKIEQGGFGRNSVKWEVGRMTFSDIMLGVRTLCEIINTKATYKDMVQIRRGMELLSKSAARLTTQNILMDFPVPQPFYGIGNANN